MDSFGVESLPLRLEKIVQIFVAEEIVEISNTDTYQPQKIFVNLSLVPNPRFTWRQLV